MRKYILLAFVVLFSSLALSCQTNGDDPRAILLYSTNFNSTTNWPTDSDEIVTKSLENGTYSILVNTDNIRAWVFMPYGYGSYEGSIFPTYEFEVNVPLPGRTT